MREIGRCESEDLGFLSGLKIKILLADFQSSGKYEKSGRRSGVR